MHTPWVGGEGQGSMTSGRMRGAWRRWVLGGRQGGGACLCVRGVWWCVDGEAIGAIKVSKEGIKGH
jgi:hypothetical protein